MVLRRNLAFCAVDLGPVPLLQPDPRPSDEDEQLPSRRKKDVSLNGLAVRLTESDVHGEHDRRRT